MARTARKNNSATVLIDSSSQLTFLMYVYLEKEVDVFQGKRMLFG